MKTCFFILSLIILGCFTISGQDCNCKQDFEWMKSTFEKNDAGFQYVIDKKGIADYQKHTDTLLARAGTIHSVPECQAVMMSWLRFFRSGHIGVFVKDLSQGGDKHVADSAIRRMYKNEKTVPWNEEQLKLFFSNNPDYRVPIEGIWSNGDYRIGIIRQVGNFEGNVAHFTAFIVKADSIYWLPGQVKAEFTPADKRNTWNADYKMRDHSRQSFQASVTDKDGSLLWLAGSYWKREWPEGKLSGEEELLLALTTSRLPYVKTLSKKTLYLRIPSFAADQKTKIDSVLKKYDKLIKRTPNLIIDIRNGTGGSDNAYDNILPYIYTTPLRHVGVQLRCTELNAQAFERYSKQYSDSENYNYCLRIAKQMREVPFAFIDQQDEKVSVEKLGKPLRYPERVAIICNHNNGSTDEQFLIDAKQSQKVKVYGQPTGGMLDISNLNMLDFPDGKFVLGYCMSKSYRIPDYCIDGVGIQPDYFIDNTIPETDWIEFVKSSLEE